MALVEEKVDLLLTQVKEIQLEQIKHYTKLDNFNTWSVTAEKTAIELRDSIKNLTSRIVALEAVVSGPPNMVTPREEEGQAHSHDVLLHQQGSESKGKILDSTMLKGAYLHPKPLHTQFDSMEHSAKMQFEILEHSGKMHGYYDQHPKEYKLPRLDFPVFDGEHPRVWKEKCEKYFRMINIPVHVSVSFATINFKGNDALWLQTYEAQHSVETWPELCVAVEQKFGKDLYQNYMRDILSIRQIGDVLEYAARFEQAKHRVLVHNKEIEEAFFCVEVLRWLEI
jgi:hypothetical protein